MFQILAFGISVITVCNLTKILIMLVHQSHKYENGRCGIFFHETKYIRIKLLFSFTKHKVFCQLDPYIFWNCWLLQFCRYVNWSFDRVLLLWHVHSKFYDWFMSTTIREIVKKGQEIYIRVVFDFNLSLNADTIKLLKVYLSPDSSKPIIIISPLKSGNAI